jgi:ubiquinone/menaquinone biosynthesis C-methylase UbiE
VTGRWQQTISLREYDPHQDLSDPHEGVSPTLLDLIRQEAFPERRVIEVGCGAGRLTFALAPSFQKIIALDWSEAALETARESAAKERTGNLEFHLADAEQVDYREVAKDPVHLVVANLCMSDAIMAQAARLGPGTLLIFAAFHTDQWEETGVISRFAYSEARMEQVLERTGFHPSYLGVEKQTLRFPSAEATLEYLERTGLKAKWEGTERWTGFRKYLTEGGDRLTVRAQVIVKAQKR